MDIGECIKNFNTTSCLPDSDIFSILLWLFLLFLQIGILWILLKFLIDILKAPFIAFKILRHNRFSQGIGYGTQSADQFIELWYIDKKYDVQVKQSHGNIERTKKAGAIAEQYLVPLKLAEIYDEHSTKIKKIKAVKNFRNRIIHWLTIQGCKLKYDYTSKYYKDLKKSK